MKRLTPVLALLLLVVPVFAAADVSGDWAGSFRTTRADGKQSDEKIVMHLTQKDADVSGTAGPAADLQRAIRNGKLAGDKLAFELTTPDGVVTTFALTLIDGHLKGEASAEFQGRKFTGIVDATRAK
jgi:hypothetical protein